VKELVPSSIYRSQKVSRLVLQAESLFMDRHGYHAILPPSVFLHYLETALPSTLGDQIDLTNNQIKTLFKNPKMMDYSQVLLEFSDEIQKFWIEEIDCLTPVVSSRFADS